MRGVLSLLVRLFPAAFRARFGAAMVEHLTVEYGRAAKRGWLSVLAFVCLTALDLVRSAVAERWNPTWVETRASSTDGKGGGSLMSEWQNDTVLAFRALRRAPGFMGLAVGTLGLAIGANAGILAVVDAVLLDPLPYADADRLVYIAASAPGSDFPEEFSVSMEFFVQYRDEADLLEDIATFNSFTATLRAGDRVERVAMSMPSYTMFATLGATPLLGRLPVEADRDQVAVISHALWVEWFGSDPEVLGRSYEMMGETRTVIGVMRPEFEFPEERVTLWVPNPTPEVITPGRFGESLVARVAPGVEHDALAGQLGMLAQRLPERFGGSAAYSRLIEQHRPVVRSLEEQLLGDVTRPLWVLLGAMGIVLLIACANVANLFMVRAERRQNDVAVRRAMGAGWSRIVRSQMAEVIVVTVLAGAVGLVLAWIGLPVLVAGASAFVPRLGGAELSLGTLAFTFGACAVAALACGVGPAMRSAKASLVGLRDGSRTTRRRHWARDGLVVAQTALALVLLVGSGLLVRSFGELANVDPGYDTEDVFTFQIAPEGEDLDDGPSFARFHMDFMDRIRTLPDVESVGVVENVPLNEDVAGGRFLTEETAGDSDAGTLLSYTGAGGDYFAAIGIDVLRGRVFTDADHVSSLGNVVISKSAAELLWPGQDPLGKRLRWSVLDSWETVVGVVDDVMQNSFRDTPEPLVYFPLVGQSPDAWASSSPAYVVKTPRADVIAPEVRALVREVAPNAPMYREFTMEGLASDSMVDLSFTMFTLATAAGLALILGMVGLYGVLSSVVAERTREIGVRMALGAEASRVRRMVVSQGVRVVVLGVVVGAIVAAGTTRLLGGLLFGIGAMDLSTFSAVSATMVLVGLTAAYVPARRASSVDPVEALRAG